MKKILAIIPIIITLFVSCEKEIDIDINNEEPQIVIEGNITDNPGPYYVKISKSVNFKDPNVFPPIKGAIVSISDDKGNTDILTETEDGLYRTNSIVGLPGNTYNMSISVDGKNYYAKSSMPQKVNLDSIRFETRSDPEGGETYVTVPVYKDPPTLGNNYRFIVQVKSDNIFSSTRQRHSFLLNDVVGNGKVNDRAIYNFDLEISKNDSVTVEMRCIDSPIYTYFNSLQQIDNSNGGLQGGITPINPPNNITGDKALGYFSAHTTQTLKQKVK